MVWQLEDREVSELMFRAMFSCYTLTLFFSLKYRSVQKSSEIRMPYVRSKRNIRRPRRARRSVRSRAKTTYRRRTTSRNYSRRKQPCVCPGELSPAAKFALAQIDPFDTKCLGAKVPDSNTMPSISNCDTDQVALAGPSTAGHLVGMAFQPNYGYSYLSATPGVSLSWTAANYSPRRNFANVVSSCEAIRPVAHAVRMSSPLAPTSATGFVHIGLSIESRISESTSVINPGYPTTVNDMTGLAYYTRYTLASLTQSPLTVINKWIDETGFRYDDPRATNAFSTAPATPADNVQPVQQTLNFNSSWATIVVIIEGTATGGVPLSFEHILLTEALPKKNAFILGTQAAPNSPGTMSAVSSMSSSTGFTHTEAGQESYINQSLTALSEGASVAGERVFNNVAVPLMQQVGYNVAMTGMAMAYNAVAGRGGIPGVNANPGRLAIT